MSSPTAPALDAANAVAQAIGRILLAMLDAFFGDVSGLAPRHPIRRAHARTERRIERYVAALAAALATSEPVPDDSEDHTPESRPDSAIPPARRAPRSLALSRFVPAPARQNPRAPPQNSFWAASFSHALIVAIS